jgi:hypothetical protein
MGFTLALMAAIGAGLAALWSLTGVYLGRAFARRGEAGSADKSQLKQPA